MTTNHTRISTWAERELELKSADSTLVDSIKAIADLRKFEQNADLDRNRAEANGYHGLTAYYEGKAAGFAVAAGVIANMAQAKEV